MTALDERPAARGHAWQRHAACNTAPPGVEFFPKSRRTPTDAYAYCDTCPVRPDCLADASRQAAAYGVWGAVLWIDGKPAPRTERAVRPGRAVHARVPDEARAAAETRIRERYPRTPITALEWRTAEGDDTEELYATVAGHAKSAETWIFPVALEGTPEPPGDGQ